MARRRMTAKQARYFGRRKGRSSRGSARGFGGARKIKLPLATLIGGYFTLKGIYDKIEYLKTQTVTGTTRKYSGVEAFLGATSGFRLINTSGTSTVTWLKWVPVNSSSTRPWGDLPSELMGNYAPVAIGVGASKLVGGNGMMGVPGLGLNRMISGVPLVKI